MSVSFSPTGVIVSCHRLWQTSWLSTGLRFKMVRGGRASRRAYDCEWHAVVVCVVPLPPPRPLFGLWPEEFQQRKAAVVAALPRGRKRWGWSAVVREWPPTCFLMEGCLLTTLYVGGLAIDSQLSFWSSLNESFCYVPVLIGSNISWGVVMVGGADGREINQHPLSPTITLVNLGYQREKRKLKKETFIKYVKDGLF